MDDRKLADNVYKAAEALCEALNAAGGAGLQLSVSFEPYQSSWQGKRLLKTGSWRPVITIKRDHYLDAR